MKIGIDLLGSENDPKALFDAALDLMSSHSFQLHAFGSKISDHPNVVWHETELNVSMSDVGVNSAASKNTSMYKGIEALKNGLIDAFISCGNTAALLTYSHLQLSKFSGVKRLGLLAQVGTKTGSCLVVDVGANVTSTNTQLVQFTLMGAATFRALYGKDPKVGILNMATEKGKGPQNLNELYDLIQNHPEFIGFIEPYHIFDGHVDLVITEGFSGNILLKTAEAVAQMTLGSEISQTHFDPQSYPGALLCGAEHLVMKCHGKGNTRALQKTIQEVLRLHSQNYITRVKQEIRALKEESF